MSEKSKVDGPTEFANGSMIGKKWKIVKKLGEGSCGAVYLVETAGSKTQAALKAEAKIIEKGKRKKNVLKIEVDILGRLKGKKYVPELLHSGNKPRFQYMVMSLLGESLNNLHKKAGNEFSMSTQLRVGIHTLHGLKQIHDAGFIHRDIKPANLAMGNKNGGTDPQIVYILDFGLSREYVMKDEKDGGYKIRLPRKRTLFRGTIRYCSASTLEKSEQGRPDDLWSLIYVMVELRGRLPWPHTKDREALAEAKKKISDNILLINSPSHLNKFCEHLRTLDYWTRPNYMLLYTCLLDAMNEGGYRFSDEWGWEDKSLPSKFASVRRDQSIIMKTQADDEELKNPYTDEDFSSNPLGF